VRKYLAVMLAIMMTGTPIAVTAQSYPSRPITIIVPFPAGGATDPLTRVLAEHLKGTLGQPVIVENVSGAAGTLGTARAARAAPDGYTLSLGQLGTHVVTAATFANVQYDPLKDFEPIALVAITSYWLVTKNALPTKDLKELLVWLKANPNKASAAMVGSLDQLAGIYFQQQTGTRFQFVPYRGGGLAIQDLVAGHVDLKFDVAAVSLPQVRSGQIKALAVLGKNRWFAAPDVPTIDEAGVPGLHISFWHGLWAPKATPRDIVMKLNAAVRAALADGSVRQRFADMGQEPPPADQQTPEALGAYHKAEIDKWWPIIKAAGIKAE